MSEFLSIFLGIAFYDLIKTVIKTLIAVISEYE